MGIHMITIPELVAQALGSFLTSETKSRFGSSHARLAEALPFAAKLTMECIGNSDALYHNIEHSMLVTLAGHDILMGRQMLRSTTAGDYANFIMACLTHDIGYVRGILHGDDNESYVADLSGRTIRLPQHVCPREIIRAGQTNPRLCGVDTFQRSAHRGIILEGEVDRLFNRKHLARRPTRLRQDCRLNGHA
jgi:hypothetical protein